MNYTNSIGHQQIPGMEEVVSSSSVSRATKAGSESSYVSKQKESVSSLDEATLSSAASLVGQALSGSDVRADKVSSLQQSIAAGTYSVPSSDVATSVLRALMK